MPLGGVCRASVGHALADVARAAWAELAKDRAAIKVASAGKASLTCVRIYKPERRVEYLRRRLPTGADFIEAVRVAKGLLDTGAFHKMSLEPRARKSEFLKLCGEALKLVNPKAETCPKQLPERAQDATAAGAQLAHQLHAHVPRSDVLRAPPLRHRPIRSGR